MPTLRCAVSSGCWLLVTLALTGHSLRQEPDQAEFDEARSSSAASAGRQASLQELLQNGTDNRFLSCDDHSATSWMEARITTDKCNECLGDWALSCKWCPLDQRCVKTGWGSGGPCKVRYLPDGTTENPIDQKYKFKKSEDRTTMKRKCGEEPRWMSLMNAAYGDWLTPTSFTSHPHYSLSGRAGVPSLQQSRFPGAIDEQTAQAACIRDEDCAGFVAFNYGSDDASTAARQFMFHGFHTSPMTLKLMPQVTNIATNRVAYLNGRVHHQDSLRCFQWAMDWPMTKIPGLDKNDDKVTTDVMGSWACTSALLRHATLRMMGQSWHDSHFISKGVAALEDTDSWVSELCPAINMKMNSVVCKVTGYKLQEFESLRSLDAASGTPSRSSVSKDLDESIRSGPLVSFKPGAGLSGSTFAATWDGRFKIKLGLKTDPFEAGNLIKMLEGDADKPKLVDHLRRNPSSVLNRYYGLLKIDIGGSDGRHQWGLWMEDASYGIDAKISAAGMKSPVWNDARGGPECEDDEHCFRRYDLKGKSRNQNRKQKQNKIFTLENGDFTEHEHSYLKLSEPQCLQLRSAIEEDTAFLDKHHLIDYSYFLTVADGAREHDTTCSGTPGEPQCMASDSRDKLYTISVIDYLIDYSVGKKLESLFYKVTLRGWKFSDYGGKMVRFAERICRTKEELKDFLRIGQAIQKHYGTAEDIRDLREALGAAWDACKDKEDTMSFTGFQTLLSTVQITELRTTDEWKAVFADADAGNDSNELDFESFVYAFS